jgi:hypothetical protein
MSQNTTESIVKERIKFLNTLSNYFPLLHEKNKVTNEMLADLICNMRNLCYLTDKEMQILSMLREYIND